MTKIFKMIIGIGLIGFSLFYLLGVILVIADAKETATYNIEHDISFTYEGCEELDDTLMMSENAPMKGKDGYTCYTLYFTAENYSTQPYYGNPADALWFVSDVYDTCYEHKDSDYERLFYSNAEPALPGKTQCSVIVHALVRDGVETLTASYNPNWDEDEVFVEISLEQIRN